MRERFFAVSFLSSTGGIGTTIFSVSGLIMVHGAATIPDRPWSG